MLTREDILAAHKRVTRTVDVPEWGGQVKVQGLTGNERDQWEASLFPGNKGKRQLKGAMARLVQMSVVEEDGSLTFAEGDVGLLGQLPALGLQRVWKVATELSGLSDEEVEELVGNFEGVQSDVSSSNSHSPSDALTQSS